MKIAVLGSGITGMGAALALSEAHDVRLFEATERLGGHANTVEVAYPDGIQPVDTGFIVYNYRNYPNLTALFEELSVPTEWSDMSFGFSLRRGQMEYACDNLDKLMAQRWRFLDPRHLRMLRDVLRFNREAPAALAAGALDGPLGTWLSDRGYSEWFRDRFLLPMGGAIWSTPASEILRFPARNFVTFFANHDLMTGLDPAQRWRTVTGGSREYVRRIAARLGDRAVLGARAVSVTPGPLPEVTFACGTRHRFDQVVLAVHGPDAAALIAEGDAERRAILGAFRVSANRAVLHSDPALMPRRRKVWSSWNFLTDGTDEAARRPAEVTYWMNRLQGIRADRPLFVSLNPARMPDPAQTHGVYAYAHPLYDLESFAAQSRMDRIQGRGGLWYAGAWLGYGFHEDGLRTGLRVAEGLGARPTWAKDTGTPIRRLAAHAAE